MGLYNGVKFNAVEAGGMLAKVASTIGEDGIQAPLCINFAEDTIHNVYVSAKLGDMATKSLRAPAGARR